MSRPTGRDKDMAVDARPTSRRALIGAGIGAILGTVFGRAETVRATDGNPMLIGRANSGDSTTFLDAPNEVLACTGGGTAISAFGGEYGVSAHSNAGYALNASTYSGVGILASSITNIAVHGVGGGSGVLGEGTGLGPATVGHARSGSTGVIGVSATSFDEPLPEPRINTGVHGVCNRNDPTASGVWGTSSVGHGVHGQTSTGWAGYFEGRVFTNKYVELLEMAVPAAPAKNRARLFVRDNGAGLTQLCVRFATGGVKVLATQT